MAAPWFQLQELAKKHQIVALSSNYALYGDMSNRVMTILREFSPNVEVYSIDESFLQIESLSLLWPTWPTLGQEIRRRVSVWTGLPVCVGFGQTKTLAKLANHLAKKNSEFDGVCDLGQLGKNQTTEYFRHLEVSQVWGVGRRIEARLNAMGIRNVLELQQSCPKRIRQHLGVVMERTVNELRGISCLELEEVTPPKKQIVASRAFGEMVYTYDELGEAVSTYMQRAAEKLRAQNSVCHNIYVFIETNRFREQDAQYNNGMSVPLTSATNDSRRLVAAALYGLRRIYRPGYAYKKAGVMLTELAPVTIRQGALFAVANPKSDHLMAALDALNVAYGRNAVYLASAGIQHRWSTLFESRTPRYTTQWAEVPRAC